MIRFLLILIITCIFSLPVLKSEGCRAPDHSRREWTDTLLSVQDVKNPDNNFEFLGCYPNPFENFIHISYRVNKASYMDIRIYSIEGIEQTVLLKDNSNPGTYTLNWDGKDSNGSQLQSGIYILRITSDNSVINFKLILIR